MNAPTGYRLSLRGLHPQLLQPVDLELSAGECLAIHGASGSGKTLLLRAIADLDPNEGEALLDGEPRSAMAAPDWRRQVAYLAAESRWWHDTVAPHCDSWDLESLSTLGFGPEVLDWQVDRLSSGERQRLALARLLCNRPRVLLLDEPTANLDPARATLVEQLVADYRRHQSASVIWISHDPAQRERISSRQAEMAAGELRWI